MKKVLFLAASGLAVLSFGQMSHSQPQRPISISPHPYGCSPCALLPAQWTFVLFEHTDFRGDSKIWTYDIRYAQPQVLQTLPSEPDEDASSIRCNLPQGAVVVFYNKKDGSGEQLVMWGANETPNLHYQDINDKITAWAWYWVGR